MQQRTESMRLAYSLCVSLFSCRLVKGASEGAGLGNAFLSHITAVDGTCYCLM